MGTLRPVVTQAARRTRRRHRAWVRFPPALGTSCACPATAEPAGSPSQSHVLHRQNLQSLPHGAPRHGHAHALLRTTPCPSLSPRVLPENEFDAGCRHLTAPSSSNAARRVRATPLCGSQRTALPSCPAVPTPANWPQPPRSHQSPHGATCHLKPSYQWLQKSSDGSRPLHNY